MPSLVFGVLDVAYSSAALKSAGINPGSFQDSTTTTGEVAIILENRYHVMDTFFNARKTQIADALASAMAVRLQDLFRGQPTPGSPMHGAEQKIEALFRTFLDANEMQKLALSLTGAPLSAAAAAGVSHRKKHPFAMKNRARPAFVDTGLYRASFRAVVKL